jgi:hypothetical protein
MKFYANPYNMDATGFYFETYDEYVEKSEALRDSFGNKVEEFELTVIDGEQNEVELANAIGVDQTNLEEVIEYIDSSKEHEWASMFFLIDNFSMSFDQAKGKLDDVQLTEMPLVEAATELFDEIYGSEIPDSIKNYIDYRAFANDCRIGGDLVEFTFGGDTFTCTNASGI